MFPLCGSENAVDMEAGEKKVAGSSGWLDQEKRRQLDLVVGWIRRKGSRFRLRSPSSNMVFASNCSIFIYEDCFVEFLRPDLHHYN
ncbi:hypothetical protein RRG08_039001 [Elysia crispata]|uniref:Uncharacterized protein n=1 Tax=Elysia crispata TaxID=231223 RepID=A0AAE0ZG76_9GAST|nr:hypothetical protein RRG08_039001 [Elysia crispata]